MLKKASLVKLSVALLSLATVSQTFAQLPLSRATYLYCVALSAASTTPVGIPFTQEPVHRDVVSGVAGPVITGANGGYGALGVNTHVVLLTTGPNRGNGFPITSNTGSTVTVSGTLPALTAGSDEFEIVPLPTLNSLFGGVATGGLIDLTGSPTAAGADKIIVGTTNYFYKTSGVNAPAWKTTGAPNAVGDLGSTPISNLRGIFIQRVGLAVVAGLRGYCRINRAGLPVPAGTNLLSWPYPDETTLLNSGLQNTLTGGPTAASADKVIFGGVTYFYKTSGVAAPGWKTTGAPNAALPGANNAVLNDDGKAFFIQRLGGETVHGVLQPLN